MSRTSDFGKGNLPGVPEQLSVLLVSGAFSLKTSSFLLRCRWTPHPLSSEVHVDSLLVESWCACSGFSNSSILLGRFITRSALSLSSIIGRLTLLQCQALFQDSPRNDWEGLCLMVSDLRRYFINNILCLMVSDLIWHCMPLSMYFDYILCPLYFLKDA